MANDVERVAHDFSAWNTPTSPRLEAKALLALVSRGINTVAEMRRLIAVSPKERSELISWARNRPELADRIESSLKFRAEVLFAFEAQLRERNVRANPGSQDRRLR